MYMDGGRRDTRSVARRRRPVDGLGGCCPGLGDCDTPIQREMLALYGDCNERTPGDGGLTPQEGEQILWEADWRNRKLDTRKYDYTYDVSTGRARSRTPKDNTAMYLIGGTVLVAGLLFVLGK